MPSGHCLLWSDVLISWSSAPASYSFPSVFIFPALRTVGLFLASVPPPPSVSTRGEQSFGDLAVPPSATNPVLCPRFITAARGHGVFKRAMRGRGPAIQRVKLMFPHQTSARCSALGMKMYHLTSGACLDRFSHQEPSFGIGKFAGEVGTWFIVKYSAM